MPDLFHTFLKYDIGHLRIIAGLWGLELESNEADSAAEELCASLLDPEPVRETMDILSADAVAALKSLVAVKRQNGMEFLRAQIRRNPRNGRRQT